MNILFKNEKYEATGVTINVSGNVLYRIRAVKAFRNVKVGDLGGWVEGEHNLCIKSDAWIYNDAKVYGNAKVYGYAQVFGNAKVFDNAQVYGEARVFGNAQIFSNAIIFGDAEVSDNAQVYNYARIFGCMQLYGDARIGGSGDFIYISSIGKISDGIAAYRTSNGRVEVIMDGVGYTLEKFERIMDYYYTNEQSLLEYKLVIRLIKAKLLD